MPAMLTTASGPAETVTRSPGGLQRSQSLRTHHQRSLHHPGLAGRSNTAIPGHAVYKRSRRRSQGQVAMSTGSGSHDIVVDQVRQTYFPPFEDCAPSPIPTSDPDQPAAVLVSAWTPETTSYPSSPILLDTSHPPSDSSHSTPISLSPALFTRTHRRVQTDPGKNHSRNVLLPMTAQQPAINEVAGPIPDGMMRGGERVGEGDARGLELVIGLMGKVSSESLREGKTSTTSGSGQPARPPKRKTLSADLRTSIGERLLNSFSPVSSPIIGSLILARDTARATIHNLGSTSATAPTSSDSDHHHGPTQKRPRPPPLRDLPPPSWSSPGPSPPLTSLAPPFSTDLFIFPYPNPITQAQPLASGGFFDQMEYSPPGSPSVRMIGDCGPSDQPSSSRSSVSWHSMAVDEDDDEDPVENLMPDPGTARRRRRSSMSSVESAARTIRPWDGDGELTPKPSMAQIKFEREKRELETREAVMAIEQEAGEDVRRGRGSEKPRSDIGRRRSKSVLNVATVESGRGRTARPSTREREKSWVRSDGNAAGGVHGTMAAVAAPGWWGWLGTHKDNQNSSH